MSAQLFTAHCLSFTGTLIEKASARVKPVDGEGHVVPVLCMDLLIDGVSGSRLHVEQRFPPGHDEQARAAASRHRKGERVTVEVPMSDLRLFAGNAAHIHVHKPHQE